MSLQMGLLHQTQSGVQGGGLRGSGEGGVRRVASGEAAPPRKGCKREGVVLDLADGGCYQQSYRLFVEHLQCEGCAQGLLRALALKLPYELHKGFVHCESSSCLESCFGVPTCEMEFGQELSHVYVWRQKSSKLGLQSEGFDWKKGARVGEADHPGPGDNKRKNKEKGKMKLKVNIQIPKSLPPKPKPNKNGGRNKSKATTNSRPVSGDRVKDASKVEKALAFMVRHPFSGARGGLRFLDGYKGVSVPYEFDTVLRVQVTGTASGTLVFYPNPFVSLQVLGTAAFTLASSLVAVNTTTNQGLYGLAAVSGSPFSSFRVTRYGIQIKNRTTTATTQVDVQVAAVPITGPRVGYSSLLNDTFNSSDSFSKSQLGFAAGSAGNTLAVLPDSADFTGWALMEKVFEWAATPCSNDVLRWRTLTDYTGGGTNENKLFTGHAVGDWVDADTTLGTVYNVQTSNDSCTDMTGWNALVMYIDNLGGSGSAQLEISISCSLEVTPWNASVNSNGNFVGTNEANGSPDLMLDVISLAQKAAPLVGRIIQSSTALGGSSVPKSLIAAAAGIFL